MSLFIDLSHTLLLGMLKNLQFDLNFIILYLKVFILFNNLAVKYTQHFYSIMPFNLIFSTIK